MDTQHISVAPAVPIIPQFWFNKDVGPSIPFVVVGGQLFNISSYKKNKNVIIKS